ncbi:hypothetical protein BDV95DRAFT_568884 [Massariosphaeria phaeospora]|uniref:Luciferase domain-containing protein n=1 Tax=Massariosphaeria phaeospora TaxID=100035 RepID=A0A7C8IBQ3_9PLEO|nr:hypothetical protein BDV95DRAFT_568884 [Massariosphaeria phaeospora]
MASSLNLEHVSRLFQTHRAAALTALGVAIVLPIAVNDYQTYLSYGPGGVPYNVAGWLVSNLLTLASREQLSTGPYHDKELAFANEPGFFPADFPPQRASPRPPLGRHAVPQRQLEQLPSEAIRQQFVDKFEALGEAAQQRGFVEIKQSLYERQHSALFVSTNQKWHSVAQQTRGEIAHIHAGLDGSFHVVLHPADSKKLIETGWGQRHGFSGVTVMKRVAGFSLPVTYMLVYAPRDEAELDVAQAIVKASIGFMAGSRADLE